MRVLESKPSGKIAIMGKKKHKLRKQAKENELCPSDSSDEGANIGRCPHISKGINFNTLRKAVKQLGSLGECTSCDRNDSDLKPDDAPVIGATGGSTESADEKLFDDIEPTIWVCLQCGHQGCDRNSKNKHALKHFSTPRSNLHALVININTWAVWCYSCDDEVNADGVRKLQECLDLLMKTPGAVTGQASPPSGQTATVNRSGSFKSDSLGSSEAVATETAGRTDAISSKPKPISLQAAASVTQGLPKVKGLSNLGNTCFFNAVMQNLSQTYVLESLLSERGQKGSTLALAGHKPDSDSGEEVGGVSDSGSGSDGEHDDRTMELPPCSFSLSEPGALTQSLVSFMKDMHNPGKGGTISPNNLFGQVCKKAPRFKGFQQQDSHELLRHLLDGMKAEEIKRSQGAILKQFHLPENVKPKLVDEETKTKVKEYGRQAKHTFVDSVFGGVFISTVQCEECRVPSQVFEPFLDISLPILEEKTVRPGYTWNWRKKEEVDKTTAALDEIMASSEKGGLSKHQQKKAKRQSMKDAKKKGKASKPSAEDNSEALKEEEGESKLKEGQEPTSKSNRDSHSQSDGEISDADIEDNIESDVSRTRPLNSPEDDADKNDSPPESSPSGQTDEFPKPADRLDSSTPDSSSKLGCLESSASCSSINSSCQADRCDSTGRSEESTLTETSAGESKAKNCHSVLSMSDSTCKASSSDSNNDLGADKDIADRLKSLDIDDSVKKSDVASAGSQEGAEETTASTSNGTRSSQRSRSSGYSSGTASKSSGATAAATPCSRSQLRLEAKFKAMSSLAPRYQPVSQECSVRSCLNQFTSAELLTGPNKFGCETCTKRKHGNSNKEGKKDTVYSNASKQVLVFQPPSVLTLHMKRFQQVGFTLRKVNRHVDFPMTLDLAPYCSSLCKGVRPGQKRVLYSLYGVVEHSGRLTGGHYTAYVKVRPRSSRLRDFLHGTDTLNQPVERLLEVLHSSQQDLSSVGEGEEDPVAPPGKWYYISDSRVTEVSAEATVLRCQAYLLFYERIH